MENGIMRWIPITEDYPKEPGKYLVTDARIEIIQGVPIYLAVVETLYLPGVGTHCVDIKGRPLEMDKLDWGETVAWTPFPEPYRPKDLNAKIYRHPEGGIVEWDGEDL